MAGGAWEGDRGHDSPFKNEAVAGHSLNQKQNPGGSGLNALLWLFISG